MKHAGRRMTMGREGVELVLPLGDPELRRELAKVLLRDNISQPHRDPREERGR